MEKIMSCPNCKQPLDEGATFCGNCGYQLMATQPQAQPLMASQQPIPASAGAPAMLSYAVGIPESSGERMSIIALIIGVIALPASIIPIAGLCLGIIGLVLGTTSRTRYKHTLNILAIIFSSIAIVAAIALWVWAIDHNQKAKLFADTSTNSSVSINTPCFKFTLEVPNYKVDGCNLESASTIEEVSISAVINQTVTTSNLANVGSQSLEAGALAAGGTLTNGHSGSFAGSPAYIANFSSSKQNTSGLFAFVLHQSPDGENIFVIGKGEVGSGLSSFGVVENSWEWK